MGPSKAAAQFNAKHPEAHHFNVTLYGSLAATGKGHLTNIAILEQIKERPVHLNWEPKIFLPFHPNAMKFEAVDATDNITDTWVVYSIGGGALAEEGATHSKTSTYPLSTMR